MGKGIRLAAKQFCNQIWNYILRAFTAQMCYKHAKLRAIKFGRFLNASILLIQIVS